MTKIKTLGLALVAVFAMSVVATSSALAAQKHFKATTYPVKIKAKGTNTHVFKIGTVTVECSTSEFGPSAAIAGETTTLAMSAKYSGCKAFGFLTATINTKTCGYTFHVGEALAGNTTDVTCTTSGDKIQITAALTSCEVQVGEQTGLSEAEYVNKAGKVEVKAKVTKIKYTVTKTGTGCPANNTEEATYNGNATAEGFSKNELGEFVEPDNIEVA